MDLLVVGLGNPGPEYEGTRHNVGAEAVARLAARHGVRLTAEKGLRALAATATVGGRRVLLAVPTTYMNDSGLAVAPLVRRAGVAVPGAGAGAADGAPGARLVVVHDELDLPSGRVKVKLGGGTAGNNGLRSIHKHLHTDDSARVRIGIGKPPGRQPGADYVLRRPGAAERRELDVAVEEAADAVELIVADGVEAAMNRVNAG
jgi:PTH1 family peptidyl-tRNA hydrolase